MVTVATMMTGWDDMEEKQRDNKDDEIININAEKFFGTPDEAFIINKNKTMEGKKGDDGAKNGDGGEDG